MPDRILTVIVCLLVAAAFLVILTSPAAPQPTHMHVLDMPNCTAPGVITEGDYGEVWNYCPDDYRRELTAAVIQI